MKPLLAATTALLLLLAGCATATPGHAPLARPDGTSPPPGTAGGPGSDSCTQALSAAKVTEADDGGTVCVTVGGEVTLALSGSGWQTPEVQGDILSADPGDPTAGTHFVVGSPGTATISSARPNCPTSGTARTCHSLRAFQIHVVGRS